MNRPLRVGSLVYATDSGLGILAKAFYDHGIITDPFVIEHAHHITHWDWFPNTPRSKIRPVNLTAVREWLRGLDVFLALETPFEWSLFGTCRAMGVKTVLMPMHECTPTAAVDGSHALPDLFLCPSLLDYGVFRPLTGTLLPSDCGGRKRKLRAEFLPVPVDTAALPWRERTTASVFVHNAGHGGLKGRNGTAEVLEAWTMVTSAASLIVRTQGPSSELMRQVESTRNARFRYGTTPYSYLWDTGDVLLFPERFNGLSLPLQEAYASGMLAMCGDRFPMNTWLPHAPLIPVHHYEKERIGPGYLEYDKACYDPKTIAREIDYWYGADISGYSQMGRQWAEENSWDRLKPRYTGLLHSL